MPPEIANLKSLRRNVAEYDPFRRLEIVEGGLEHPSEHAYAIDTYMAGMYLRTRVQSEGLPLTRAWLNRATNGHGARTLQTYADFIPPAAAGVSRQEIYERYRNSVSRQFAS